ncbi:MAG: hypothetical protein GVY15_11655 [Bacteroidetes bacterium]|jgi:hypothetical protein|nr:hypothetical protein [Bacteroidota bacterium]
MKFILLLVLLLLVTFLVLYLRGGGGGGGGGGYNPPRRPYPGGPVEKQEKDESPALVDATSPRSKENG